MSATLATNNDQYLFQPVGVINLNKGDVQSKTILDPNGIAPSLYAAECRYGGGEMYVLDDQGGSQINVRTDGKSPTIRAEMHGNVPCVMESAGFCTEHSEQSRGIGYQKEVAPTLRAGTTPAVCIKCYESHPMDSRIRELEDDVAPTVSAKWHKGAADTPLVCRAYSIENHPADSRVGIDDSGKVQTLTSRMGTGGGNVPMVMEPMLMDAYQHHGWRESDVSGTLTAGQNDSIRGDTPLVCERQPVYCLQGNGIDRADTAGCNGRGWNDKTCYTLNTIDRPAVAYSIGNGQLNQIGMSEVCNTLDCMHDKQAVLVGEKAVCVRYIVRRLTPTECARLQGFADRWGDIEWICEDTKGEEPQFWREVYMTDCAIKGKKPKPRIAEMQSGWEVALIRWHNQLHTDSAEYKMWGNGVSLPTALYCMQGIAEAMDAVNAVL